MKKAMKSETLKEAIPDITANSGGLANLIHMDYAADPKEVFKNVGDVIVPLIATGLALIPGVGPIIGGVLSVVWGIFSSLFGGPPQKSPMELAIEKLQDEVDELKKTVQKLPEKIIQQTRKEMDETLKNIFYRMIHGELSRNRYICNKYALISEDFVDDLRNNRSVNELRRIELVASLNDCDNFLKDTATAFVLPEYADVLWIPSVYATLSRVAFLTEVCNYGFSLQLDRSVINMLWMEMKADIERQFEYAIDGIEQRVRLAKETAKNSDSKDTFRFHNFSEIEMEACRVQSQLLYMDREKYPFGVPGKFVITSNDAELDTADFNVTFSDEPRHIQIFYNEIFIRYTEESETLLNCIMGPTPLQRTMFSEMTFRVSYVPNKSYELRVLYFTKEVGYSPVNEIDEWQNMELPTSNRTVAVHQEEANTVRVIITAGKPNENNLERFLLKSGYNVVECDWELKEANLIEREKCNADAIACMGTFVTENVGTFNMLTGNELKGKIIVQYKSDEDEHYINTVIFGAELIIRPAIV